MLWTLFLTASLGQNLVPRIASFGQNFKHNPLRCIGSTMPMQDWGAGSYDDPFLSKIARYYAPSPGDEYPPVDEDSDFCLHTLKFRKSGSHNRYHHAQIVVSDLMNDDREEGDIVWLQLSLQFTQCSEVCGTECEIGDVLNCELEIVEDAPPNMEVTQVHKDDQLPYKAESCPTETSVGQGLVAIPAKQPFQEESGKPASSLCGRMLELTREGDDYEEKYFTQVEGAVTGSSEGEVTDRIYNLCI
eukprot:GHVP01062018.1.p1 GENE.GHVP01062018.1~~GHVP01062018.1.p1  ORF type:complete len:245 (+),score=34.61 GHVP01062018.1:50-784(+)